jgi:hypothetical protein
LASKERSVGVLELGILQWYGKERTKKMAFIRLIYDGMAWLASIPLMIMEALKMDLKIETLFTLLMESS